MIPGLLMFALLLLIAGLSVVCALIAAIGVLLLVLMGITSSSVLIATLERRVSAGLRAFHYQVCIVLGVVFGEALAFAVRSLADTKLPSLGTVIVGLVAGALSGLALAYALDEVARFLRCRFFPPSDPPLK